MVEVVMEAIRITSVDFAVLEGMRSLERQKQLVARGASTTMNSRHITGHAVDLGAYVDGEIRWDWPLYYKIADAMFQAAEEKVVDIDWGGHWKSFPDGPHFQLSWEKYPV
jgi:peptidoglycan L-alanyl-D-glutamate endopeptidase CwlK